MHPFDARFTKEFFIADEAWKAIREKDYDTFYRVLESMEGTFCPEDGNYLCRSIIMNGATFHAFRTALSHCPPLEEFSHYQHPDYLLGKRVGLLEKAAFYDRADIVTLLLEMGESPNAYDTEYCTPLEAAAAGGACECTRILLAHPQIQVERTEFLRQLWEEYGTDGEMDACLELIESYMEKKGF